MRIEFPISYQLLDDEDTLSKSLCPRCEQPLEPGGGSTFFRCTACDGALVAQSALLSLLEALAEDLKQDGCLNDVVVAIPDKKGRVACPQCGSQMENYGYLSSDKVHIDGCSTTNVISSDQNMAAVGLSGPMPLNWASWPRYMLAQRGRTTKSWIGALESTEKPRISALFKECDARFADCDRRFNR